MKTVTSPTKGHKRAQSSSATFGDFSAFGDHCPIYLWDILGQERRSDANPCSFRPDMQSLFSKGYTEALATGRFHVVVEILSRMRRRRAHQVEHMMTRHRTAGANRYILTSMFRSPSFAALVGGWWISSLSSRLGISSLRCSHRKIWSHNWLNTSFFCLESQEPQPCVGGVRSATNQ
jgi:hypothetical protein